MDQFNSSKQICMIQTALRDIVDVLYDGWCNEIPDEEILPTIRKKINDLQYCPEREKTYKLLKILSILKTFQKTKDQNCNMSEDIVLFKLRNMIYLCEELLKHNEHKTRF